MPQFSADPWSWLAKGYQGYLGMLRTAASECPEALIQKDLDELRKWHGQIGELLTRMEERLTP